jgi:2-hydroxychromene-2-carboxylate isomerase
MKTITFWLDFISPYAYLAFEQLPRRWRASATPSPTGRCCSPGS